MDASNTMSTSIYNSGISSLIEEALLPMIDIFVVNNDKNNQSGNVDLLIVILEKLNLMGLREEIESIINYILEKCTSDISFGTILKCISKTATLKELNCIKTFAYEIFSTVLNLQLKDDDNTKKKVFPTAAVIAYSKYDIKNISKNVEVEIGNILNKIICNNISNGQGKIFHSICSIYNMSLEHINNVDKKNQCIKAIMKTIFKQTMENSYNNISAVNIAIDIFKTYPANNILTEFIKDLLLMYNPNMQQKGQINHLKWKSHKIEFLSNCLNFYIISDTNDNNKIEGGNSSSIINTIETYIEMMNKFWYDLMLSTDGTFSNIEMESNALALFQFVDSVYCALLNNRKTMTIENGTINDTLPKFYKSKLFKAIVQIFPYIYTTQLIGTSLLKNTKRSKITIYAEDLYGKYQTKLLPQLWMIYLKVQNVDSERKQLPLFCNELYVNSLKELWKLKDIENKSTNATLSMYDFCNQFVDVCLVSTDTVDPDQLGIMSLLDHLSIFNQDFWILNSSGDNMTSGFSTKNSETFTNCLAAFINRLGISTILMGVYNSDNETWNEMGEAVLEQKEGKTIHALAHLLYSFELKLLNAKEKNMNNSVSLLLEKCYEKVLKPFFSHGGNNNIGSSLPELFHKHFKSIVSEIISILVSSALSPNTTMWEAFVCLKASERVIQYLFGSSGKSKHGEESIAIGVDQITISESNEDDSIEISNKKNETEEKEKVQSEDQKQSDTNDLFKKGDAVRYIHKNGKFEAAVILQVHPDEDEGRPYFSIRLSSGNEKQTEQERLQPLASYVNPSKQKRRKEPDGNTKDLDKNSNSGSKKNKKSSVDYYRKRRERRKLERKQSMKMAEDHDARLKLTWKENDIAQLMAKLVNTMTNSIILVDSIDIDDNIIEKALLISTFHLSINKILEPLLPTFENIEYEIGVLDEIEDLVLKNEAENLSQNFRSKMPIALLHLYSLFVGKSIDAKRFGKLFPKIQKLTDTVLKNSGKADTNLSFNSLLQIRVQSLLSYKLQSTYLLHNNDDSAATDDECTGLETSLKLVQATLKISYDELDVITLNLTFHGVDEILYAISDYTNKNVCKIMKKEKNIDTILNIFVKLMRLQNIFHNKAKEYLRKRLIDVLNRFIDVFTRGILPLNFLKAGELIEDDTLLLTFMDLMVETSSPKIQIFAFHIISNEYKSKINSDVCLIFARKLGAVGDYTGTRPSREKELGFFLLWHLLLRFPTTLHNMCADDQDDNDIVALIETLNANMLELSCFNLNVFDTNKVDISGYNNSINCNNYFGARHLKEQVEGGATLVKAESLVNENLNEEIPMASSNSNNNTLYNDNVIHVLDIKVMIHYFSRYYDSFSLVAAKSQTIMSLYTLMETVLKLPNIVRKWWKDMKRGDNDRFAQFMSTSITPAIISREISQCKSSITNTLFSKDNNNVEENYDEDEDEDTLTITGSVVSRDIIAEYVKKDCKLEICISLPTTYPLRAVEISCRKRTGVKPEIWRRWALQIRALLSLHNTSISAGIVKFCENVDKEFSGVEPCPICYCVIHIVDRNLPRISCKVCHNKFHSSCLHKWFSNSQKSTCPLCRSVF